MGGVTNTAHTFERVAQAHAIFRRHEGPAKLFLSFPFALWPFRGSQRLASSSGRSSDQNHYLQIRWVVTYLRVQTFIQLNLRLVAPTSVFCPCVEMASIKCLNEFPTDYENMTG